MMKETKNLLVNAKFVGKFLLGLFLFWVFVVVAFACSDGSTPVYDDQGNCVANCGELDVLGQDGSLPDDLNGRDTNLPDNGQIDVFSDIASPDTQRDIQGEDSYRDCGSGPDVHCSDVVDTVETDLGNYKCPYELVDGLPPDPFDRYCLPDKAREARCAYNEYSGETWCKGGYNPPEQGYIENCADDSECQWAPPSDYPPCVCWDACGLWWFTDESKPKTWYCHYDDDERIEVTTTSYFTEISFQSELKNLGSTCGIQAIATGSSDPLYNFFPNDKEKKLKLFFSKVSSSDLPSHSLTLTDSGETIEVRDENGKIFAICERP